MNISHLPWNLGIERSAFLQRVKLPNIFISYRRMGLPPSAQEVPGTPRKSEQDFPGVGSSSRHISASPLKICIMPHFFSVVEPFPLAICPTLWPLLCDVSEAIQCPLPRVLLTVSPSFFPRSSGVLFLSISFPFSVVGCDWRSPPVLFCALFRVQAVFAKPMTLPPFSVRGGGFFFQGSSPLQLLAYSCHRIQVFSSPPCKSRPR